MNFRGNWIFSSFIRWSSKPFHWCYGFVEMKGCKAYKCNGFDDHFEMISCWNLNNKIIMENRLFGMKKPTFCFTGVNMFFLSGSWVLEPDLGDSFAKPSDRCYSLEILSVWVAIYLEVCLQHLKLFFGERRSYSFSFVLVISIAFTSV